MFEYPASTAEQQLFNKKRLIDITQFTRITDDADGNFVLKELTPYKTIKANSLKSGSAVTEKSVTTISSRRTIQEADVFKKVSETEKYQVFDTEVEVNGNLLLENVNQDVGTFFTIYTTSLKQTTAGVNNFKDTASIILDDSTNEWVFSRLPETANLTTSTTKFKHDTTDLLILKHNEVEVGVGLKVGTITFADNSTLTTAPTTFSGNYNDLTNLPTLFDGQYSSLTGTPTLYTDADARTACYPITQVNTGLPLISSGINVFDTDLWFNSTDGQRRLQFENNADTVIHCPSGITNNICLRHNGSDRFRTGEALNKSVVSMEIGPSPYPAPVKLTLRGGNSETVSSAVVFGDGGTGNYYSGMMIYYDSQFNKLKFSADFDSDNNIDLEPAITIQRDDRYVGILKSIPVYPLDVVGDIQTSTTLRTPQIDFPDPLAFIKPEKFQIHGVGGQTGATSYETETFTNASGGTNTTMSGFNTNLFINGSIGTANAVGGFGQINGISGSTISKVISSGTGSGSTGTFNSLTSTGFSNYFILAGGTNRLLRTKDISSLLSTTNTISFNYIAGTDSNGGNYPETGETLYLEFLSNTGSSITKYTIHNGGSFYSNGSNFTAFQHTLSATDKTATHVRWIQNNANTGNFDHYGINNIVFAYSTLIPDPVGLFIRGPNENANSSVVCFGYNGVNSYYGGMTINYDSVDNKLQFGGDTNDDGTIDADSAITILNSNKYVGVLKDTPAYPLDVVGDISTSTTIRTPRIDFADGTNITSSSAIATNTNAIAVNTSSITTNTGNIATNTGNITTNTNAIAVNTSSIATNTGNIATNTGNITTNANAIAVNTSDITTNTSDIATNTANITANTSAIATNAVNITNNTNAISALAPAIWKYSLNSITNVNYIYSGSSNNYPAIFSGTGHVLLNLNAPLIINSANELKITIAGYYQIHISFRFRNNQGNNAIRASIQNFLEINGSFGLDRVATNYMRYTGNAECACTNQACLVEYFNVNDLVRIGFMRIGNSTLNCELFGTNSTITFQRIA